MSLVVLKRLLLFILDSPGLIALHTIHMPMTLTFVLGNQSIGSRLMYQTACSTSMPGFLNRQNQAPKLLPQTCAILVSTTLVIGNSILPIAQSSVIPFFLPSKPVVNPMGLLSKYIHNLTACHPFTATALVSPTIIIAWPISMASQLDS